MSEADKYVQSYYDPAIEDYRRRIEELERTQKQKGWSLFGKKEDDKDKAKLAELKKFLADTLREKEIYLSYPPHVVPRVKEAFENTEHQQIQKINIHAVDKFRFMTNELLEELAKKYIEFELLPTSELKQRLVKYGVLAEEGEVIWFPTTNEDALVLSIYVSRLDKEKVELDRVRTARRWTSEALNTAPGLIQRADFEKQLETIESRLEEIEERPDDSFNWSLKKIGGEVRVYTRANNAVAAVFTLPRGVYRLDIRDDESGTDRTPQRLRIEDAPYELKLSPSLKRGEIEITGESGISDTIPLY